jgi:hypothetical protein
MNLRPSNLEQISRPTAIVHDAVVSERDAFRPIPVVSQPAKTRARMSVLTLLTLALGGALTMAWGGMLLWLLVQAVKLGLG